MEQVAPQAGSVEIRTDFELRVWRSSGRWSRAVQIAGQQAVVIRNIETNRSRHGVTRQHGGAIIGASSGMQIGVARQVRKHIVSDVITIRPDTQLRVVGKIGERILVDIPCTRGVAGLGNRNALSILTVDISSNRKLRQHPAFCQFVILGNGVP